MSREDQTITRSVGKLGKLEILNESKGFRNLRGGKVRAALPLMMTVFGWAENPIIQTKFTADPAPMVWNDTVFLYTSHDEDYATGSAAFQMKNWLLYTSTDMVNWRERGIVASLTDFKWGSQTNGAWAPQVIQRNGKFYFYAPIHGSGIGVLVANSPYGPFKDPIGKALVNSQPWTFIDPTVFVDTDGQAYLYFGNPDAYSVKLNADMISTSGSITKHPKISTYQEGPWAYKRGNHYYLAFASTCCPEGIGYAMSTSPTGPWTYKGSIMDANGVSNGNHPGIIDFKGKSYVFGFNYSMTKYLDPGKTRERRSVCLANMKYNADGTIPKVPFWGSGMPTANGIEQVGTLNPYVQVEAETMAWSKGLKTEAYGSGGINVTDIQNGDYLKIKGVDFAKGAIGFEARVASATSGGSIEIRLDSETGKLVGTLAVPGTGGWQTWTTKSCQVQGAEGVHDLYLKFTGGSGNLFNFDWWKFAKTTSSIVAPVRGVGFQVDFTARGMLVRSDERMDRVMLVSPSGEMLNLGSGSEVLVDQGRIRPGVYVVVAQVGARTETKRLCLVQDNGRSWREQ